VCLFVVVTQTGSLGGEWGERVGLECRRLCRFERGHSLGARELGEFRIGGRSDWKLSSGVRLGRETESQADGSRRVADPPLQVLKIGSCSWRGYVVVQWRGVAERWLRNRTPGKACGAGRESGLGLCAHNSLRGGLRCAGTNAYPTSGDRVCAIESFSVD
jgi:hypothetical protein